MLLFVAVVVCDDNFFPIFISFGYHRIKEKVIEKKIWIQKFFRNSKHLLIYDGEFFFHFHLMNHWIELFLLLFLGLNLSFDFITKKVFFLVYFVNKCVCVCTAIWFISNKSKNVLCNHNSNKTQSESWKKTTEKRISNQHHHHHHFVSD